MKALILSEWFDINNHEHLKAWKHLGTKGSWPIGFLPENVEIDIHWVTEICAKMANAWVTEKLANAEHETTKLKDSEFLKDCDTEIHSSGELVVLNTRFGGFNWPTQLNYDGKTWKFNGNVNMGYNEVARYGGKARYTENGKT